MYAIQKRCFQVIDFTIEGYAQRSSPRLDQNLPRFHRVELRHSPGFSEDGPGREFREAPQARVVQNIEGQGAALQGLPRAEADALDLVFIVADEDHRSSAAELPVVRANANPECGITSQGTERS